VIATAGRVATLEGSAFCAEDAAEETRTIKIAVNNISASKKGSNKSSNRRAVETQCQNQTNSDASGSDEEATEGGKPDGSSHVY
jgi:hypothetical protein